MKKGDVPTQVQYSWLEYENQDDETHYNNMTRNHIMNKRIIKANGLVKIPSTFHRNHDRFNATWNRRIKRMTPEVLIGIKNNRNEMIPSIAVKLYCPLRWRYLGPTR